MKTRKMWMTNRSRNVLRWTDVEEGVVVWHQKDPHGDRRINPVLVTDAYDMPDFEPGDRVRVLAGSKKGDDGVVRAVAYIDGAWRVFWRDGGGVCHEYMHDYLTKLPRETSVLLRLTGETAESCAQVIEGWKGVRVERVEDDDE